MFTDYTEQPTLQPSSCPPSFQADVVAAVLESLFPVDLQHLSMQVTLVQSEFCRTCWVLLLHGLFRDTFGWQYRALCTFILLFIARPFQGAAQPVALPNHIHYCSSTCDPPECTFTRMVHNSGSSFWPQIAIHNHG